MLQRVLVISFLLLALVGGALTGPAQTNGPAAGGRAGAAKPPEPRRPKSDFARLIDRLSESGGYFDSDNLISNESSYLHVLGRLRKMNVTGGAYIGVGPDQNFSYIAQIRPRVVYMVDIRRDNLLQHLLFKALFAKARNRLEYLCLLFGKPFPEDTGKWKRRSLQELLDYIDKTPARRELFETVRARMQALARQSGVPLTVAEVEHIGRIHHEFFSAGLDLRYTSRNRAPRPFYPTYRELLLEKDLEGRQANYLAREEDFQFLKSLQKRDLIIPAVGNLAGEHALAAIGRAIAERGERVSAFYTSNVEFYLMRDGSFGRFAENLKQLPRDGRSVIIRSYFNRPYGEPHPQSVPGYYSTQLLQTIESLVQEHTSGGYQSYLDLVNKHALELR